MKQTKNLPLTLNIVTALLLAATAFFIYLHAAAHTDLSLTLAITFATTTYHFAIRLLTGFVFQHTMKNRADLTRSWYQLRPFEQKLYRTLRVKTWKNKLPTYYPDLFDPSLHSAAISSMWLSPKMDSFLPQSGHTR